MYEYTYINCTFFRILWSTYFDMSKKRDFFVDISCRKNEH